jgi:ADP-ribosylglycohydrolase
MGTAISRPHRIDILQHLPRRGLAAGGPRAVRLCRARRVARSGRRGGTLPLSGAETLPATPLANSFWISPRLLAGEYPGADTAAATQARLDKLIGAGITYFIDLTLPGELPPYDHLLPPARADDGRYVIYVRKAIRDHGVPHESAAMQDTLDYLGRALEVGHRVYVHGRAGIGRTNTVIGCWLRRGGLSGPAALERLNALWQASVRVAQWPHVPETEDQKRYVLEWRDHDDNPFGPLTLATMRTLRSRYHGCMLGLACGDALGATLQYRTGGQFTPIVDMAGGGHWRLQPGAWTDDTAMALCLADSLLDTEDCIPADQLQRYRLWQQQGYLSCTGQCIAITAGVAGALARSAVISPPSAQALSRAGVVALYSASTPERVFAWTIAAAEVTDRSVEVLAACQCHAACVLSAIRGATLPDLLDEACALVRAHGGAPAIALCERMMQERSAPAPGHDASEDPRTVLRWIVAELMLGGDFRDGLLRVVNRGGDADMHGAIFGQLAGALYGAEGIPKAWRRAILRRDLLQQYADRLLVAALAPHS